MRFIKSQTSFKSGRLSPKLFNRIDTNQYKDGASVMKGFRPIPEGGATVITGKRWINDQPYDPNIGFDETKQISFNINGFQKTLVLVKNTFNQVDAYIYTYPYTWGTEVSFNLIPSGPTEFSTDLFDYAIEDNHVILTHFNGNLRPNYLKFNPDNGAFEGIFFQNNSALIQAYGEFQDTTVNIGNATATTVDLTSTDPVVSALLQSKQYYYAEALGSKQNSGDGRTYNFIASNFYTKVSNITNGVRVNFASTFTEGTTAEALTFAGITSFDVWATNLYGNGNWPKTITNHEGRVVFGGCKENPLSLAGSRVGNIFNFNRLRYAETGSDVYLLRGANVGDATPTDPYLFTVSADEDSQITAVRSAGELFIGTDRKEYVATGGDTILSRISVQIKPYTSQGVYPVSTVTMGNLVCYTDQARKKLFQFKFNDKNGTFLSDELSLLFNDLMEDDQIKQLAWAPHIKVLYILTDKEILYGITYDPSSETQAFFETLQTGVTSISYVAAREEEEGETHHRGDHVLLFVREKGLFSYEQVFFEKGIDESYVKEERLEENEYMYLEDVFDIKRISANNYSINGLSLAPTFDNFPFRTVQDDILTIPFRAMNMDTGEMVTIDFSSIILDGANPLIDNPAINGASRILVGNIPTYEKVLATMPIEAGQQFGPAQLGIKNIDELGIRFYKSYSYKISGDGNTYQEVRVSDNGGRARTGREETKFQASHKYDFIVWIKSDKPEPLLITGINMRGVSNDG